MKREVVLSSTLTRLVATVLAGVTTVTVLAACSSSGGDPAGAGTLTLYNGQHEQTTDALVQAFEKKTGIHVTTRTDDEGVLANVLALQGGSSSADVFYAENSPALEFLQGKGLLAAASAATLSAVPAQYN